MKFEIISANTTLCFSATNCVWKIIQFKILKLLYNYNITFSIWYLKKIKQLIEIHRKKRLSVSSKKLSTLFKRVWLAQDWLFYKNCSLPKKLCLKKSKNFETPNKNEKKSIFCYFHFLYKLSFKKLLQEINHPLNRHPNNKKMLWTKNRKKKQNISLKFLSLPIIKISSHEKTLSVQSC